MRLLEKKYIHIYSIIYIHIYNIIYIYIYTQKNGYIAWLKKSDAGGQLVIWVRLKIGYPWVPPSTLVLQQLPSKVTI